MIAITLLIKSSLTIIFQFWGYRYPPLPYIAKPRSKILEPGYPPIQYVGNSNILNFPPTHLPQNMLYILCYCSSLIKKFCNARDYILFLIQINGRIASLTHDFYCCFVTFQSLCQQLIVRRQNKLCINSSVSLSAALCGTSWSVPFHNYNVPRSASTALHASISPGSGLSTRTCPFPDGPVLLIIYSTQAPFLLTTYPSGVTVFTAIAPFQPK